MLLNQAHAWFLGICFVLLLTSLYKVACEHFALNNLFVTCALEGSSRARAGYSQVLLCTCQSVALCSRAALKFKSGGTICIC